MGEGEGGASTAAFGAAAGAGGGEGARPTGAVRGAGVCGYPASVSIDCQRFSLKPVVN